MAWDFIVFGGSGFVVFDLFSAHGRSTIQRFKLKDHNSVANDIDITSLWRKKLTTYNIILTMN